MVPRGKYKTDDIELRTLRREDVPATPGILKATVVTRETSSLRRTLIYLSLNAG